MNIYFCNISKINEEVEDFVIAKNKIEKPLIESEQLEKKMSIQEFLDFIDLTKTILMFNDESNLTIPFSLTKTTEDNIVVIYAYDGRNTKYVDLFKEKMKEINYNISTLKEISQIDILQGITTNKPYFVVDNKFYI